MMPEPHRNGRDGTNNMQLMAVAIGEYSTHFAVKIITTGGLNAPALPPARPRARVC